MLETYLYAATTPIKPLWDTPDLPQRVCSHSPADARTLRLAAVRTGHHAATIVLSS